MSADPEVRKSIAGVLKGRMKLFNWFIRNASVKHGVPLDPDEDNPLTVEHQHQHQHQHEHEHQGSIAAETAEAQEASVAPQPDVGGEQSVPGTPQRPARLNRWQLAAIGLATAAGLGGGAVALWPEGEPAPVVSEVEGDRYMPALEWLEREGEHVP